ncbi:MAG: polysaccharide pyruvyl transferase family protein [Bacteroides sp.]|nr:polysaccharide pyruvyl transferase family protein [Roseburia sp.]MCM1347423.1 polysaccharide pyruvyl transferase family protein [Bacteroides sp.]MCM1421573.1 polysaccharide pyruvyl transferase family protein [Bacteroides sp.]
MKIGILTLPLHTNYGGILQAYALQTVLERMGHEVEVIDKPMYRTSPNLLVRPVIYLKRYLYKMLGKYKGEILTKDQNKRISIEQVYTRPFINKYIHRAEMVSLRNCRDLSFDAVVVGSDQVWRALYFRSLWNTDMTDAFLGFCAKDVKRVAYAASFGTDKWEFTKAETKKCTELIHEFSAVSTREESGIKLCGEYLKFDACKHTLDPTMLLSKEYYISLFETARTPQSKGTLLCYMLDETEEKEQLIELLAKEKNLKPFKVNSCVENHSAQLEECCQPPVEQWLKGFHDAKFVITDSFHACVFSIIFNKPFIVVGNVKRGLERFYSLLKTFDLEQCLLSSSARRFDVKDIDWVQVNYKLAQKRQACIDFLEKGLE